MPITKYELATVIRCPSAPYPARVVDSAVGALPTERLVGAYLSTVGSVR